MQISVTFRHMDASDSVRAYIEEKLARIKKYLDEPIDAQAVVGVGVVGLLIHPGTSRAGEVRRPAVGDGGDNL